MLHDRQTVHHHEPCDRIRVIHGGAEGNQRATVMAHNSESVVAEPPHERDYVVSHRSLRGLSVPRRIGRQRRLPVAAQVRAHHKQRVGEPRRNAVPGRVRPRMAMQQHYRVALAAMAHAQRRLSHVDILKRERFEHEQLLPA
jgi:hypothetical protein